MRANSHEAEQITQRGKSNFDSDFRASDRNDVIKEDFILTDFNVNALVCSCIGW